MMLPLTLPLEKDQMSSVMAMALGSGNPQIVELLIQHNHWDRFLTVELPSESGLRVTPMRRLIKEIPEMAELVMDKCWKSHDEQLTANFELVDDMYLRESGVEGLSWFSPDAETYPDSSKPYSQNYALMKRNHPLKVIEDTNAKNLMDHPLITALIRRKWRLAVAVYFPFLVYYMIFIGFFTASMVVSQPFSGDLPCDNSTTMEFNSTKSSHSAIRVATIVFAVLGLIMEFVQLYLVTCKEYIGLHNLLDWLTYIGSIVLLSRASTCDELTDWQFQLGVAGLFLSYMNILFFLRIIPFLGIYVMMVGLMLWNFVYFFIIMFLFLFAFGICFYLLTQNQEVFSTIPYSVMKSYSMMLGDIDFAGIFLQHVDNDEPSAQLHYMALMWVLYIAFLIFMSLVILNLLTSLSVSGVETLQKDSQYKILALQINLALDVEFALPTFLHKKVNCCVRFQKFQASGAKHCVVSGMIYQLQKLLVGNLSQDDIRKRAQTVLDQKRTNEDTIKDVNNCIVHNNSVISSEIKEIEKAVGELKCKVDSKLDNIEETVDSKLYNIEKTVDEFRSKMDSKLNKITQMLERMLDTGSKVETGSTDETASKVKTGS